MAGAKYPCLGFDPARGNVGTLHDLAREFDGTATYAGEAYETLNAIRNGTDVWTGDAAKAFAERIGDLPGYLDTARSAMDSASRALRAWADQLAAHQRRAVELEQAARKAVETAERADAVAQQAAAVAARPIAYDPNDPASAQAAARQARANQEALTRADLAAAEAWGSVEDIRRQAEQLLHTWNDDSAACARVLREAGEAAPDEGLFEAIGEFIAGSLETIGDIAGIISAVAGVLAFVPGLNVIAAPIALVSGAVALGAHAADITIQGKWDEWNSYVTLAGDALGLVPGVGAVLKGTDEVVDAAGAGVRMLADDAGELATTGMRGFVNKLGAEMLHPSEAAQWVTKHALGVTDESSEVVRNLSGVAAKVLEGGVNVSNQVPTAAGLFTDGEGIDTSKDIAGHTTVGVGGIGAVELIKELTEARGR